MPLPPIKPPEKLLLEVYKDLLQGPTRRFGDALTVMADRMIVGRVKSLEERALDYLKGEAASENRRRLAAEAIDRVPPTRRTFPAPQIAGPIFRDSEFELPETPVWELWSQLLSRACDRERAGEAHPAFPGIIRQLAADEAVLLTGLAPLQPQSIIETNKLPHLSTKEMGFLHLTELPFYLAHLGSLGLLVVPTGWDPIGHAVMIDDVRTYILSAWGRHFMSAVSHASQTGE